MKRSDRQPRETRMAEPNKATTGIEPVDRSDRWQLRTYYRRRGRSATYGLVIGTSLFGLTLWRRGAVSFLAPFGDGVPLQIVHGDWWRAHDR